MNSSITDNGNNMTLGTRFYLKPLLKLLVSYKDKVNNG
jgi:hypothetical protein